MKRPSNPPNCSSSVLIDGLAERYFRPTKPRAKSRAAAAAAAAAKHRRYLVKWLRKKWRDWSDALALADTLDGCRRHHRCHSGACPECGQAMQNLIVRLSRQLVAEQANGEGIAIISIVQETSAMPLGELHQFDPINFVRRLKYGLAKAGVGWVVGAIDYSQNEHQTNRYVPFWQPHFFGFTAQGDLEALRKRLKRAFPKSDAIPRPVYVKTWNGRSRAFRYMFKMTFKRRIGQDESQRFDKTSGTARRCRATKSDKLRSAEYLELLLHLDAIGLDSRVVNINAQVTRTGDGPKIRLLKHRKP